jgi:hypothetical protein
VSYQVVDCFQAEVPAGMRELSFTSCGKVPQFVIL